MDFNPFDNQCTQILSGAQTQIEQMRHMHDLLLVIILILVTMLIIAIAESIRHQRNYVRQNRHLLQLVNIDVRIDE